MSIGFLGTGLQIFCYHIPMYGERPVEASHPLRDKLIFATDWLKFLGTAAVVSVPSVYFGNKATEALAPHVLAGSDNPLGVIVHRTVEFAPVVGISTAGILTGVVSGLMIAGRRQPNPRI